MRRTTLLLFAIALLPRTPLCGQVAESLEPPVIRRIVVHTRNVFDSTEAGQNFFFRLANAIHFTTRPSVVRHELLFREGEPYDQAKVDESLRNLRSRGLFRDVAVYTVPAGDSIDVIVETADGWTTQLVMNAWFTAGELSWALGAVENNVFGTGANAGVVYRNLPDRTALQLSAGLQRIRGTRFEVAGAYDNLSDGHVAAWIFGLPFRALGDRAGFLLAGETARQRILEFRDSDSSRTFRRRLLAQRAEVAWAPWAGTGGYLRLGVAGQVKREEFLPWETPEALVPDTVSGAIGLLADFLRPRYQVVTHYNGFAREEDLDLSTRVTVVTWLAPSGFGYAESGVGPALIAQTGIPFGKNFVRLTAQANGLFTSSGLDSGQVNVSLTAASMVIPRNATVFHIQFGARKGTPPGFQYDLGHGIGPRAFGPHAFTGDRTIWGSLEQRVFLIDEFYDLFGVGFAAFVDYGGAWYDDQPRRLGGNVGFGLRLGSTRSTAQNVGRIDLGYRFGEGWEGKRLALSFGRGFAF
jgi:hypothetical protein